MTMTAWSSRLIRASPVLLVSILLACFILPLVNIQLRLWRNGAIATRLVDSLRAEFPGAKFRGNVSYEREVVYINVLSGLAPEHRRDVEQLLRRLKAEQRIAPAIWLWFPENIGEAEHAIKI
jgi:hypothetical protein